MFERFYADNHRVRFASGPISVSNDLKPLPKPFTWNSKYAMIFVDQV